MTVIQLDRRFSHQRVFTRSDCYSSNHLGHSNGTTTIHMFTVLDSLDKQDKAASLYEQEKYRYYAAINIYEDDYLIRATPYL